MTFSKYFQGLYFGTCCHSGLAHLRKSEFPLWPSSLTLWLTSTGTLLHLSFGVTVTSNPLNVTSFSLWALSHLYFPFSLRFHASFPSTLDTFALAVHVLLLMSSPQTWVVRKIPPFLYCSLYYLIILRIFLHTWSHTLLGIGTHTITSHHALPIQLLPT